MSAMLPCVCQARLLICLPSAPLRHERHLIKTWGYEDKDVEAQAQAPHGEVGG